MKFKILILLLLITNTINAQFPDDVTYQSYTSTTPILPSYLGTIVDTDVTNSITIKRITQFVPAWNWYPIHEYAKAQPWNADASIYKIYSVAIYDANTHVKIRNLPGGQLAPSIWSNTNSDIIYGFKDNGDINSYSIANNQVSFLYHITDNDAAQTDYDIVQPGPGEGNIDKNDRYMAFACKKGTDMDVVIFDLQANQIVHTELFTGAWGNGTDYPQYVDWVSVSQSGNYVGIMWNHNTTSQASPFNTHFGVEIYNTTNMQYLRRIATYGNHGDFGYAQNGDEVLVQFWGDTGTLNMFYLDRMERVVLSTSADFSGEGHVSCRNLNRPGWAYVSQDEVGHTGQIVAFKLDNSGLVEHFGHHYGTASTYTKSPMPCPNPNGDKVMFKSDFGDFTNDVIFSFEASRTNTVSVDKESITSVNLYPNPTTDVLNIQAKTKIAQLEIYTIFGQLIKAAKSNSTSLQVSLKNFEKGIYILKLTDTKGDFFSEKVVVK